jgi:signal transduction histidine kinase/PAS domain-containing protein
MFEEALLHEAFDALPDMVFIIHPDTLHILYANRAATATTSYSQTELLALTLPALYCAGSERVASQLSQLDGQNTLNYTSCIATRTGDIIAANTHVNRSEIDGKPCLVCVLRQQPLHHTSVLEQLPVSILTCDVQGRPVFANAAWDTLNQTITHQAEPQLLLDKLELADKLESVMSGQSFQTTAEIFSPTHHANLSLTVHGQPLYDADATIIGGLLLIEDGSLAHVPPQHHQGKTHYRSLVNAIPDLLFRIRGDGLYLDYKLPAGLGLRELPPEDILGKYVHEVVPPGVADRVMPVIRRVIQTGQIETLEYQIKEPGGLHHYEARFNVSGANEVVAVVRDITQQKLMQHALRESEATARALMDAMADTAAILVAADRTILAVNEMGAKQCDTAVDDLVGQPLSECLKNMPPKIASFRNHQINMVFHTRLPLRFGDKWDDKYYSNSVYPLFDSEDCVTRIAFFARDITARKRTEARAERQARLLKAIADATKSLLAPGNHNKAIENALAILGQAVNADRIYTLLLGPHPDTGEPAFMLRHEWRGASAPLPDQNLALQHVAWINDQTRWAYEQFLAQEPISVITSQRPPAERYWLEQVHILSALLVPVFVNDRFWGVIGFDNCQIEYQWTDEEKHLLQTMAASMSAALERQQVEEALKQKHAFAETLREVGNILSSTLEVDEVMQRLLSEIEKSFSYDSANVMLIEGNRARIAAARNYERVGLTNEAVCQISFDIEQAQFLKQMRDTRQPYMCADVHQEPAWFRIPNTEWIRSWLGAPITFQQKVLGFFSFDSREPNHYTQEHLEVIKPYAIQAGIALENAQLYKKLQTHVNELNILHRAGKAVLSSLNDINLDDMLLYFAEKMTNVADATSTLIFDYDPNTRQGTIKAIYLRPNVRIVELVRAPGEQISLDHPEFHAQLENQPTIILQASTLKTFGHAVPCLRRVNTALVVRLEYEGQIIGIAIIRDNRPHRVPTLSKVQTCKALADLASIAIKQATLFADVQQLEQFKSRMIQMASHDLRNPLASIHNMLEMLEDDIADQLSGYQNEYFPRLWSDITKMDQIIRNLLSLERIEAQGRLQEPVHWQDLLEKVVEGQDNWLTQADHSVRVECDPDLPVIEGDRTQLSQAITNLVSNAIKYTPPGGDITLRAFMTNTRNKPRITVEVQDNGMGIPAELQGSLFQPFYRAQQLGTEQIPGIGLGLSAVKTVAQNHNGDVYFKSEPGQGSVFGFWVPV